MSSNRLKFDTCSYKEVLTQSQDTLSYVLDTTKFDNCQKCRIELGTVGGTAVSQIAGNLVDLENDLRGQTRMSSNCSTLQYSSPCVNNSATASSLSCQANQIYTDGTKTRSIDTSKQHLAPCQMVRYKPVPLPSAISIPQCSSYRSQTSSHIPEPYNS